MVETCLIPLTITYLAITILQLDPQNARQHSKRQVQQIAESIKTFGFLIPILIDASNRVIAGNGRLLAAMMIGMKEVPIIRVEHLNSAQRMAFAIADNKLTLNATWNEAVLRDSFKHLLELDLSFDIEVTGFSTAEIDLTIDGLRSNNEVSPDPADDLKDTIGNPVAQQGDIFHLGRHHLHCGDATQKETYENLLGNMKADAVIADLPYDRKINGVVAKDGRHREFMMGSGELGAEFPAFLSKVINLATLHVCVGALLYLFMDWRSIAELINAARSLDLKFLNLAVWVKNNGGMGSFYRSRHELIGIFRHGNTPHRNNIELGRHGRNRTNVWEYPGFSGLPHSDEGNLGLLHPTVKPVAMLADIMLDCTRRGDLILDPFIGSGSTIIAAQRVGRICYGIEIDPHYVDVAIRRWQRFTGQHAVLAATGQRFDDIAAANGAQNV